MDTNDSDPSLPDDWFLQGSHQLNVKVYVIFNLFRWH